MSELESTDLICEARRRELSEREQRRLEELLSRDLGARLIQLMQPELERSSRVRPGDDMLGARMAEYALGSADCESKRSGTDQERQGQARKRDTNFASGILRRSRGPLWLLAAAITFGATGAAAWWATHSNVVDSTGSALVDSEQARVRPIARGATHRQSRGAESQSATGTASTGVEVGTTPDAALAIPSGTSHPSAPDPKPVSRRHSDRVGSLPPTAAQLFSDANLLRREGQSTLAMRLYRSILSDYPTTREASLSRLVLAKALAAGNPKQSLAYYQEVARTDGSLRAEALWGIVEVAGQLKQTGIKEQALMDLVREFPESAYADVARQRMKDSGL